MTDQHKTEQPAVAAPVISGSEVKKLGFSLYIKIPASGLECRCSYVPRELGSMITRDDMAGFLKQYKVLEGIDQEAFDNFVTKAAAGEQLVDVLLASGTPPVLGTDEYIALSVHTSAAVHSGEEEVTDIDMHIVQTFINVSKGDGVGRIIPADPGTPGRTIAGLPIATHPGKPMSVKIGKNIRTEEDGALLIAAATGRLCQTSGEISVEEEYIVKGDLNFRIGSIDFKGVVEVRGDVLDNFNVTASKGLSVTGNIGACNLVSDGDITFCGMNGQDRARIACGGMLRAHFIHDVDIECTGDVIVDVEIHNCNIKTLGKIVVDKGAISGGSYIALGGIEAKKFGSAASVHTKLHAGVDYHDVGLLEKLFASLAETQDLAKRSSSLTEIQELRKTMVAITDGIMEIRGKSHATANAKINVKTVIYENVQLVFGNATEMISEEINGACSFVENSIEGGLRHLSMTSLDVKAADIEQVFVREESMKQHHE